MIVEFTTACAISVYHHKSCEFEHRSRRGALDTTFVIKFVSDLRQGSIQLIFSMTGQEKGDLSTHVTF